MAAPIEQKLPFITGQWYFNAAISDSPEPVLILQGIGWLTRKAIGLAGLTVVFRPQRVEGDEAEEDGEEHQIPEGEEPDLDNFLPAALPPVDGKVPILHLDQIVTGGLSGSSETRHFDGLVREHSDWLFGTVKAQSLVLDADQVAKLDDYLAGKEETSPWLPEGSFVFTRAVSPTGWIATQLWGFQNVIVDGEEQRRFARNVVVTKGAEVAKIRLLYDFLPEVEAEEGEEDPAEEPAD